MKIIRNHDSELKAKSLVEYEYRSPQHFDGVTPSGFEGMRKIEDVIEKAFDLASSKYLPGEKLEVFIIFTDNKDMQEINREQRDIDKPTDVLAFPMMNALDGSATYCEQDINPETGRFVLGDIVISVEMAAEQAIKHGHSLNKGLLFLALHGFLHLMGYDHDEPDRKKFMFDKQREVMKKVLEVSR